MSDDTIDGVRRLAAQLRDERAALEDELDICLSELAVAKKQVARAIQILKYANSNEYLSQDYLAWFEDDSRDIPGSSE